MLHQFFKKDYPFNKNYRPVSVLLAISKIYEKLMQRQINNYMTNHLSPYLFWYRKGSTPDRLGFTHRKMEKDFRR